MDTWVWIVIAAAAALAVLTVVRSAGRAKRSGALKDTFETDDNGVENVDEVSSRDEARADMSNVERLR